MSWYKHLSRRQFIRLGAAAAAAAGVSCNRAGLNPWRFLTVSEARTLASICDQLVPPDHDPGADWARVVNYIDIQLCGHFRPLQKVYRAGLAALDRASRTQFGQSFAALSSEQQIAILTLMESNKLPFAGWSEISPRDFFELLLDHTMQGYYGDPRHGGNRDHASWKMVGIAYPPVRGRYNYDSQKS